MHGTYLGLRIVTDPGMVEPGPVDLSRVRSLPRALRRQRKRPLPRLMVPKKEALHFGDMLVMHPAMFRALQEATTPTAPAVSGIDKEQRHA